tara:strand:- start:84 stop:407 length:324 start_codon:yes stop_codon:yes gene_type:complete
MAIQKSTDKDFEKIISSETPSVIKFEADWCQPCKILTSVVEEVSEEMKGKVNFFAHNVENDPNVPTTKVGPIRGIPHVCIFRKSEMIAERTGSIPKSALVAWIKENI